MRKELEEFKKSEAELRQKLQETAQELERANRQLQRLDQLKSEFVSSVSHELRTPLSITKEGISLVLDRIPGQINEKQEKILVTARDNIDRLFRIINSLLDISKIEAGKVQLKKEQTNLLDLIKEIILSFELKVEEKGLKLKVNIPKDDIKLYVDHDRIIQVFTNLIGNSLKFTQKGHIEISVMDKEGEVECSVADTGTGITKEDLPRVFEKFQQFNRVPGPGEKGTGLGLSIVKGIIDVHKGRIWVESEVGKGTKFTFTLSKRL